MKIYFSITYNLPGVAPGTLGNKTVAAPMELMCWLKEKENKAINKHIR